jgi:Uma2 family endonuclease
MMAQRAHVLDPPLDDVILAYDREGPIPVSEETYIRLALEDPDTKWELHDGLLVEKPGMSVTHLTVVMVLGQLLSQQLDVRQFLVLINDGRLRRTSKRYFIPDVAVISADSVRRLRLAQPRGLGVFDEPLPFVAEGWSPSTGRYDVKTKIPTYQLRGDQEIWRVHPFKRTVTAWRLRPDGKYDQIEFTNGRVQLHSLPQVVIDLDEMFGLLD